MSSIVIVSLTGGLGNQMLQYYCGVMLGKSSGSNFKLYLDLSKLEKFLNLI